MLAALLATTYTLLRRQEWLPASRVCAAVFIGIGLFVVPTVALSFVQSWIDPFTQVILLALTPVFAVVLEPHIAPSSALPSHALVSAIGAASGLLLIFPFQLPRTTAAAVAWIVLLLAVATVAASYCHASNLAAQLRQGPIAPLAAITSAASALAFLFIGILAQTFRLPLGAARAPLLWSILIDAPSLLLLFWLLPRLSASRIAARLVVSPLFSSLIALLLLHPAVTTRDIAGLLLAAAGSVWLLLAPTAELDAPVSPLHLGDTSAQ